MTDLSHIRGLLIDLDGTLYVEDEPIEGAVDALRALKSSGLHVRGVTNTTTKSAQTLAGRLAKLGIPLTEDELVTPVRIAASHLRSLGNPIVRLVLQDDAASEFQEFDISDQSPDAIVVGDIGPTWDYELMSSLFRQLVDGAAFIALHKGRFYQGGDGLVLDIGAFVAGLEYASGVEARVIGKPSKDFFHLACGAMDLDPASVAMVGDDIDSDVGGAQRAGLTGILVKTGKYRPHLAQRSKVEPDRAMNSIADLTPLILRSSGQQ